MIHRADLDVCSSRQEEVSFQLDFQLDDRSLDLYIQHKMNVYMVIYFWPKLVHLILLHTVSTL